MGITSKKPGKIVAVVTYCVALICLLLGLFLPYDFEKAVDTMLFSQLPAAVDALFKTELSVGEGFFHSALTYSYRLNFFGLGENPIDLGAILVLLYTLFTVGGLIALIPVFASKKESRTALKAASVIEVLSLIPLFILVFIQLDVLVMESDSFNWIWGLWAAFGGTLLMLIIQSFAYKKGSGFVKFLLFLLSALAILLAVFPITSIIPPLKEMLDGKLGDLGLGLFGNEVGLAYLILFFQTNFIEAFDGMEVVNVVMLIATMIAMTMVVINAMLDMMGLGKLTSKSLLICNIIRYTVEVIAIVIMIIMSFMIESVSIGLMLWVLTGIAVIQLVINIIRTCVYKPVGAKATETVTVKKEKKEKPAKAEKEKKEKPAKVAEAPKAEATETAVATDAVAEKSETANDPMVYNVGPIYNGPTDSFIKKLTNEEKIEFAKVFLERRSGNLPTIPNYDVGGDNSKFFASIFIYYGRIRGLVSDGLMNKFYEQGNMMN